jgi:hypothetical protein
VAAFIDTLNIQYRVDTLRNVNEIYSPFFALHNRRMTLWLDVKDDSTSAANLQDNTLLLNLNRQEFSSPKSYQASYEPSGKTILDFYGPGQAATFHWRVQLHTGAFPKDRLIYLRYRVGDGDHSTPWQLPHDDSEDALKYHYSFYNG